MKEFDLEILTPIPPANKQLRMHWAQRAKIKKALAWEIRVGIAEAMNAGEIPEAAIGKKERRTVRITLFLKRRYDKDNLHAACKGLIDAMRHTGLIWNDSPEWIDLKINQFLCGKARPQVSICVEFPEEEDES